MDGIFSNEGLALLGECMLLSSMNFSIGSVEMSSKFSVKNFSKDQQTLNNASEALYQFLKIAAIWSISLAILFYAKHGIYGFILTLIANFVIVYWIYDSYIDAFEHARKMYNLEMPTMTFF
jgi:hypothetical protein